MITFKDFFREAGSGRLAPYVSAFQEALERQFYQREHGDLASWQESLARLPDLEVNRHRLDTDEITVASSTPLSPEQQQALQDGLMGLHPWRKGPFNLFGTIIDTEWRSDWKWQRLQPHLSDLRGRHVLDVGCGSGYHCWRAHGDGAALVLGIDPSVKYLLQFLAIRKYLPDCPVHYLPLRSEDLPPGMACFDTVLSMGVIYHRKSPLEHLEELKGALISGGELVLETLVVPGDESTVLTPPDRYAQMRNVWMIPSAEAAAHWLRKVGFREVRIVDITVTTPEEQRRTDWMKFMSLSDFLDPEDAHRTIEGHPAPTRATLIARKP